MKTPQELIEKKVAEFDEKFSVDFDRETVIQGEIEIFLTTSIKEAVALGLELAEGAVAREKTRLPMTELSGGQIGWNNCRAETLKGIKQLREELV